MIGSIPAKAVLWDAQQYYITTDELKDIEGTMVTVFTMPKSAAMRMLLRQSGAIPRMHIAPVSFE